MEEFKKQLISISSGKLNKDQLVSILLLTASQLEINTVSEMARLEGKTPRGILISKQYKKISIGKAKLAIKGVQEDGMPF